MIEYFEDAVEPPLSAKKSSKPRYFNQAMDTAGAGRGAMSENNDLYQDEDHEGNEDDPDADGVPVLAELVDDDEIFCKPGSPIH